MADFVTLPEQRTPVIAECDVLVVGGGAAGMSAAIAAARQGADTVLVERYGYMGGLASGGLIVLLLTLDDGDGNQVVAGQCQELVDRLDARGACYYPPKGEWGAYDDALVAQYRRWGLVWGSGPHRVRYSVAYDPEEYKHIANTWVAEAGVRLMYHRWASDVVYEIDRPHGRPAGRISHVVFTSKAGRQAIRARYVIDATGDGDVFTMAGEGFELEKVHPWLWFRMANVRDVDAAQAAREGFFFRTVQPGRALMPWGAAERIERRVDATDPDDLTFAEVECRRMVMDEVDRLRAQAPGFEDAYLSDVALTLGITESRRLDGAYTLARDDVGKPFDDAIAITGHWTKYSAVYQIPYRSLLPKRTSNLLVAGRCISVDHRVHHATKEIPPAFATGEAAGIAAAQALRAGCAVQDVDVASLQAALRRVGVLLP
ncbi:MAG TPA: FAD-dependent oxidoreductase [Dehalococcoidia bacterium]|nr:FAD-dependent oxidoreductase [Dehalococcoidia bacterium]